MKLTAILFAILFIGAQRPAALLAQPGDEQGHWTTPYNVVWTSPSHDAAGSMPLGNGQVGINLWVEEDGDLRFYISRNDSFTEVSRLVKVGGVRISLDPNPFKKEMKFRQELKLVDGVCEIVAKDDSDRPLFAAVVVVDAESPVIYVAGITSWPAKIRAAVDDWRTKARSLAGEELNSSWTLHGSPVPVVESADVLPAKSRDSIAWYHRNETSPAFASTLKVQSLESVSNQARDPLLHRTFGGYMTAAGSKSPLRKYPWRQFRRVEGLAIESPEPEMMFAVRIAVPCVQTTTAEEWIKKARFLVEGTPADQAYLSAKDRTSAYWHKLWDRSHIVVSGDPSAASITRGYILQRYMQAIGGRGPFPIKFNGGQFTVEPKALGKPYNADWRAWGDCFWWQNTRHMYHPMLAAGDFEMMDPLFAMYEAARPLAEARTRLYHGAEGCYFPETMTAWGTYSNGDYGWNRAGHQPKDVQCPWWQYAWNQGPELVSLMLDRWDYTGDEKFLTGQVLPMAESVLKYFDTRFKKDAAGRIVLDPDQSVETYWHGVINDMPTTAGLNDITARLCALPERLTSPRQREFFRHMRAACPTVPTRYIFVDDVTKTQLAPAQKYNPATSNCENPELYAVWPFRLYGLGRPGLEIARNTYARRHNHLDVGWGYDGNCAALLGLTDEAARILKVKCANSNPAYRWPATWGPNFDWLPDQNHGGNLLETTQLMLLQPVGSKLLLLPAWPKKWDVDFKLHAPRQTVVECVYRGGRIEHLTVSPESRRADVVLPKGISFPNR